jgi:hypothetical protein
MGFTYVARRAGKKQDFIGYLREHADESDLLLVDRQRAPWQTDDRWLAPAFRGRMYSGNLFESERRSIYLGRAAGLAFSAEGDRSARPASFNSSLIHY